MPKNPNRASQGGDVSGTTRTDVTMGQPVEVAEASYDPGYPLENSLPDTSLADLKQGYCGYGRSIGEGRRR